MFFTHRGIHSYVYLWCSLGIPKWFYQYLLILFLFLQDDSLIKRLRRIVIIYRYMFYLSKTTTN